MRNKMCRVMWDISCCFYRVDTFFYCRSKSHLNFMLFLLSLSLEIRIRLKIFKVATLILNCIFRVKNYIAFNSISCNDI